MQSYELNINSDVLKDRHPYLELPFQERYSDSRVYLAVFDRCIDKLIGILNMTSIEEYKYRDCMITLNEMISHQEMKEQMISKGLVQIVSQYLDHHNQEIRRESMLLLGSMFILSTARDQADIYTFNGMSTMLFEQDIKTRESCMWAINRFVTSRDGVNTLCQNNVIPQIIQSFLNYTHQFTFDQSQFIIYLLEAFTKILQYENGIQFFFNQNTVQRMNNLLANYKNNELKDYNNRINYLMLDCLSKITENEEGKEEAIQFQVIRNVAQFLDSNIQKEVYYSIFLISNITLHLEGKKEAINFENQIIIKKCIQQLENIDPDIVFNVKQILINISDLPDGFQVITEFLLDKVQYLDDIFNVKSVISLSKMLPLTSQLKNPPFIPLQFHQKLTKYVKVLCYFLLKYEQAIKLTITETQKIEEKLLLFLMFKDQQLQDQIANTLYKICYVNVQSRQIIAKYINKYGENVENSIDFKLSEQIQKYSRLYDLLEIEENYDL